MREFLKEIIEYKKEQNKLKKSKVKLSDIKQKILQQKEPPRNFKESISMSGKINIIAEIKKASPSAGIIKKDFDPVKISKEFTKGKADAISVLTEDKYFLGDLKYLGIVHENVKLPVLCKDFFIDEYQIYEARINFADALLLIAAILSDAQISDFLYIIKQLGMSALVEIHNETELNRILKIENKIEIIGINNRNLDTFKVDLNTTYRLLAEVPKEKIVVSESGIKSHSEIQSLKSAGVNAILIGEYLMSSKNISAELQNITKNIS